MKTLNFWSLLFLLTFGLGLAACSSSGGGDDDDPTPDPKPGEERKNDNVTLSSESAPASFTTKVLLEDYTGTWCGYCPRVAHSMEEAINKNANVIGIGIHQGDKMESTYIESLLKTFNIQGFPTAKVNRSATWNESYSSLETYLNKDADLGISLSSTVEDKTIKGQIKIGFKEDISKSIDYVVLLVEDKVLANQRNFYNDESGSPFYGKGDPIVNFEHANVLRKAGTDIYGDVIPEGYTKKGKICQADFEITLGNYIQDNCYIVAFVVEKGGKKVLNTQIVKVGSDQAFD
jgi:thiol-disulfide isomerase/thioredoxin